MKKIGIILQSRMGSTRLPGKVMADISGKPMLLHIINRLKNAKLIKEVIIATTNKAEDKQIIKLAKKSGIKAFKGSINNVLSRYYKAAKKYKLDIIVRVTGDCPLIDPMVIDRITGYFLKNKYDYISNTIKPTYPDGLDMEVFTFNALGRAYKEAKKLSEKEHVTPYIWKHPEKFKIKNFEHSKDLSHLRWTVDEKRDLLFIKEIYRILYKKGTIFYMEQVLRLLKEKHALTKINKGIKRNEGYIKSLKKDKNN